MKTSLLVCFLLFSAFSWSLKTFHGNQVFRLNPTTQEQVDYLKGLRKTSKLDFWSDPTAAGALVDIHVPAGQTKALYNQFVQAGINVTVWIKDVQALVEKQQQPISQDWYSQYHTFSDIITWVKQLPRRFPHLASLVPIGKSYQGRDLLAVQITSNKSKTPVGLWYDGGIHAREWITVATVAWMTNQLLTDYGTDPAVTALLDNSVITVLPVFNPDGYDYTWTGDRMWRKTRSPNSGTNCVGTDPNRNWDFHWGEAGSSSDPCDESFMGAYAFSEIEIRTVAGYIKAQGNIQGYINFHSYSQLWMSPWGWTDQLPADYNAQNTLSANCVQAISNVFGTSYQYGPIATTIYPASGSSADWTYGVCGAVYSYGVELRDTGEYGFLLPPDQIVPSGQETYAALKVWAQTVIKAKLAN